MSGLVDFLIPPRQQRLLAALLLHPERSYSYNELIRIGGPGRGANQKAVHSLLDAGLAVDARMGNQRRIQANPQFPLYPELRAICVKSFGVVERVRTALAELAGTIDFAFIFGSLATGKDHATSDIDLFIVGTFDLLELDAALAPVESDLGRAVHVTSYGREEWLRKRSDRVVQKIMAGPKLMVIGDEPTA